ncbi:MAG: hypothetical protein WBW84_14970, partial [Acidobacteriaceae bacterium]
RAVAAAAEAAVIPNRRDALTIHMQGPDGSRPALHFRGDFVRQTDLLTRPTPRGSEPFLLVTDLATTHPLIASGHPLIR